MFKPPPSSFSVLCALATAADHDRSEEHTSELQSLRHLVCRLLLEKKKKTKADKSLSSQTSRHVTLRAQRHYLITHCQWSKLKLHRPVRHVRLQVSETLILMTKRE